MSIPTKFGSNWPISLRKEILKCKSLPTTEDGCQVMELPHMTLGSDELETS